MENTSERLRGLIIEYAGVDEHKITDEADLLDDLGIDSLEKVELIMAAEEEFGVEINDDLATRIRTVGDCVEAIAAAPRW